MKRRGALTSLALVVLAVLSLVYAYGFDRGRDGDADRSGRASRVFPGLDAPDATEVFVESAGERLHLRRSVDGGASWDMISPHAEPADPAAVAALLEDMRVASRVRDVSVDSSAAGLAAPRAKGWVAVGSVRYAFELGAPAPVPEGSAYMRLDGKGVFVTDRLLAEDLLRGADAYRDRILVPYGASETARVTLHDPGRPDPDLVLSRTGRSFRVDGGVRASRSAVEALFAALGEVHADSFVADADATPDVSGGLEVTLVPTEASRPRVHLRFEGGCPAHPADVVVLVEEPFRRAACIPSSAVEALRRPSSSFLDDGLLRAHADEVSEIRFDSAAAKGVVLDLARRGSGWHERAPEDRELAGADAEAASALVERLVAARATQVVPPSQVELLAAQTTVTVVGAGGPPEVLAAGVRRPGAPLRVRRSDDGAVLVLPYPAARDIEAPTLRPGPR